MFEKYPRGKGINCPPDCTPVPDGPHSNPSECPLWYDSCYCVVIYVPDDVYKKRLHQITQEQKRKKNKS